MKRLVQATLTVDVEFVLDDEATSDHYEGETFSTAHANPERFIEGSAQRDVVLSLAVAVGLEGRRLSNVDGWADFPDEAAAQHGWPSYQLESWHSGPAPERAL